MIVRYVNQQNKFDPMNGSVIAGRVRLVELLDRRRNDPPFLAELSGNNGFQIMMGIGGDLGCVQYSCIDGKAPYLMAVSAHPPMKSGYVEFLTANTPTPFAARYILRFDAVKKVAIHFLETGERSDAISWQSLEPGATREDAECRNLH